MRLRLGALAIVVAALCLGSASAAEAAGHPSLGRIFVEEPTSAPLKDACGVAIDASGTTFVSNYYEHAVYIFSEEGEFLERIAIPEPPLAPTGKPFAGPCDLAVDPAGNLYVNNWHNNVVKLVPTGPTTFAPGVVIDANESTGVAVDPATGNLLVADRTADHEGSYVAEYAAPVTAGAAPVRTIGAGSLEKGYGVAVSRFTGSAGFPSTAGWIYAADAADNTVKVFNPGASLTVPVEVIDGDGTPQAGFNHLADTDLTVDPLDGHLYVVDNLQPGFERPEAVVDEFSSLGHYRGPVPPAVAGNHPSGIIDAEPSSLAISPEDNLLVTSGNYFNDNTIHRDSEVQVFGPAAKVATRLLTVSKLGTGAGRVSSSPAGLGCGTACVGEFTLESTVVLGASAAPHNRFAGWSGCASELSGNRCAVTMGADQAVGAEFEPVPQLTLALTTSGSGGGTVVSAPAGIECRGSCGAEFDEGSQVTLAATADAGSSFAGWSGCDSEPSPGSCRVAMSAARSVGAGFDRVVAPPPLPPPPPPRRILAVSSTGLGTASGTVTSSPAGIDCGGSCASTYEDGTNVTLLAHPAAGSTFLGWGGCDGAAGDRCTVRLGADKTVVAAFGPGSPGPLRFKGLTVHGATAVLRVSVPSPGALSASGSRLRPASALPVAAGEVALRLRLTAAGLHALAVAQRHALNVHVALAFAPFDGGATVHARKTVAFGSRSGR